MPAGGPFINQTYDETQQFSTIQADGLHLRTPGMSAIQGTVEFFRQKTSEQMSHSFFQVPPANAVYYYGLPRCCGALYAICVDCLSSKAPIFETIDAVNVTDVGDSPPIVLWSKTFDTPGIHEILLTDQNDSRFGRSQITIDRFELQIPNTATSSISGTLSTASSLSSVVTSSIPETSSNISSTFPASNVAQSKPPLGAIIGGVRRYRAPDDPRPPGSMPFIALVSSSPSLDSPPRHNPSPLPRRGTDPGPVPDNFSDGETLPPGYDQISLALSNVGLSTPSPNTKQ
ncbi:hypothetical protein F5877DRAFT_81769 [Lentinula edodes]|nr:hypothetical protein F5877DRAFT_81769 [Lentinula edodes]